MKLEKLHISHKIIFNKGVEKVRFVDQGTLLAANYQKRRQSHRTKWLKHKKIYCRLFSTKKMGPKSL